MQTMSPTNFQASIEKIGSEGRRVIRVGNDSDFVEIEIFQAQGKLGSNEPDMFWFADVGTILPSKEAQMDMNKFDIFRDRLPGSGLIDEIRSKICTGPHSSMSVNDDAEIIDIVSDALKTALAA